MNLQTKKSVNDKKVSGPFATFLAIHFEVGGDTKDLEYQSRFWPAAAGLVELADHYDAKLTLQFNPQWAEYILKENNRLALLKSWQKNGHEVALHHHGYDHRNWNGYTNRPGKSNAPGYRGRVEDMIDLVARLAAPYKLLSGTITDEGSDHPECIKYDTEGIRIDHARSRPQRVVLGGNNAVQVGMAFLSFDGDIRRFKEEYARSEEDEVFGVVTHEYDFRKNPGMIEEWLRFIRSQGGTIKTVSDIIADYQKVFSIGRNDRPLTFSDDIAVQ